MNTKANLSKTAVMLIGMSAFESARAQFGRYTPDFYEDGGGVASGSWVIGLAIAAIIFFFGSNEVKKKVLIVVVAVVGIVAIAVGIGQILNEKKSATTNQQEAPIVAPIKIEEPCVKGDRCKVKYENGALVCARGVAAENEKEMIFSSGMNPKIIFQAKKSITPQMASEILEGNKLELVRLCY